MFELIPALDVRGGQVVRLYQGDFSQEEVIADDPMLLARRLLDGGANVLHVVDLDGALAGSSPNQQLLETLVKRYPQRLQVGGGLRSLSKVAKMLESGALRVIVGTVALEEIKQFREICAAFPGRVGLGLDIRNGKVCTRGWLSTSEVDMFEALDLANDAGAAFVVYTDVTRDGTLSGPNIPVLEQLLTATHLPVIASGGVSCEADVMLLRDVARRHQHLSGVIVGKAIYKGTVSVAGTTLRRRVIPCLDVSDGKVVKGTQFNNIRAVGDPVSLAKLYAEQGADEIVMLDISATQQGRTAMLQVVERVARQLCIPLTVGGGVKSNDDVRKLLRAGADKVAINTAMYRNPGLLYQAAKEFGSQCIVAAVDARRISPGWEVVVAAGSEPTGLSVIQWLKEVVSLGAGEVLLTSIDSDGGRRGYDLELLEVARKAIFVPVIASGGAGCCEDLVQAFAVGADACLVASILHYGQESVCSLKTELVARGVALR